MYTYLLAACHLCSGNKKDWVDILGWFAIHNLALRYFDENQSLISLQVYHTRPNPPSERFAYGTKKLAIWCHVSSFRSPQAESTSQLSLVTKLCSM